jgi:hypothetical protein
MSVPVESSLCRRVYSPPPQTRTSNKKRTWTLGPGPVWHGSGPRACQPHSCSTNVAEIGRAVNLTAMITTLVSGGQTGADRAALDVALAWGVASRGWVPRGRLAEDGRIPARYRDLEETASADPAERTRLNIRDADGALIVSHGPLHGGSLLALETARQLGRPVLHVDLADTDTRDAVAAVVEWITTHDIRTLGVGGPRASDDPQIFTATLILLSAVLGRLTAP